jgi:hypothetical protein
MCVVDIPTGGIQARVTGSINHRPPVQNTRAGGRSFLFGLARAAAMKALTGLSRHRQERVKNHDMSEVREPRALFPHNENP